MVALVLLMPALSCAQTMYKWVDEKGVTHFSEQPPPDPGKASKVTPKVTPPSSTPSSGTDWKARDAEFRKRQIERGKGEQADARDKEKRQGACSRSRSRLSTLQNTQRIYRDNPDGTRSFMSDSERDSEVSEARDAIREYCD